jgi:hypothetical protein
MFTPTAVQFLGVVQVRVGNAVHTLPVRAMNIAPDSPANAAGGLFEEDGAFGIIVNMRAGAAEVEKHVRSATEEAVRLISRRALH